MTNLKVHGDIRHLEKLTSSYAQTVCVHGDIRHLEIPRYLTYVDWLVHGDIRHLENEYEVLIQE